jgi:hypothetical protein
MRTVKCDQVDCGPSEDASYLRCINFDSWSQVNTNLLAHTTNASFLQITLKPRQPLILNHELDFETIITKGFQAAITSGAYMNPADIRIDLIKIGGINANLLENTTISESISKLKQYLNLYIESSPIKFYTDDEGKHVFNATDCEQLNNQTKGALFFNYFNMVYFYAENKYTDGLCPYIFRNSNLNVLTITGLVATFFKVGFNLTY